MNTLKTNIESLKNKVQEASAFIIRLIENDNNLPLYFTYSDGYGLVRISKIDDETVQFLFEYQTSVLLNVLFHKNEISLYRFGLDNYYLEEAETLTLMKETEDNLKELIPYLQKINYI